MICQEGLEEVFGRHRVLGRATREAARALDLELLGERDDNSNVVTAIRLPDSIDGGAVPKLMRDRFGVTIAGGQGRLKGKIARVAHCGYFGALDIVVTVAALELCLSELGHEVELGAGVAAAQRVFAEAGHAGRAAGLTQWPRSSSANRSATPASSCCAKRASTWSSGPAGTQAELASRIAEFDGILIRSATRLDAELLARADNLKAVGRAGVGVDNVDVEAATKRGVVVANAPQSNVITAAEHTLAMLLALARKVPQAHRSLTAGKWERSRFSGVELYEKTLGVLGFGRVGQLVAQRAISFGMHVVAFDVYTAGERFRELGVERADSAEALYAQADFITIHLPVTAETENWLDAEAFSHMKDGVRVINVARGKLMVEEDLVAALDSGKVAGAALDVFREEPVTENPLFGYPNVVVTPHLGASTAEATDRAGYQAAEQVVAALTGGVVTSAVNVPAIATEDIEVLGPFLPAGARPRTRGDQPGRGPLVRRAGDRVPAAASPSATPACSPCRCSRGRCPATSRRT